MILEFFEPTRCHSFPRKKIWGDPSLNPAAQFQLGYHAFGDAKV